MKRILLTTTVVFALFAAKAQTEDGVFYFRQIASKLDESTVNTDLVRDHFLGESVAVKLQILKDSYTYIEPESATNGSPKLIIEKPEIYNNVKKIEKFYKKSLKDGTVSQEQAVDEFSHILSVAIYIRNQQTNEFEEVLKKAKEDQELVALFTKSVRLENY